MKNLQINDVIDLNDGGAIPQLGFGVFQITDPSELRLAVETALDAGYRHFDTATVYKNEEFLGEVLANSGVARPDFFLTTKCWISSFGKSETRQAFNESLARLRTDYVDLYLLHWPLDESMMDAWETLIDLQAEGKVKSIGVSNFSVARFEKFFFKHTDVIPAVNQIESHPMRTQSDVQAYGESKNMVTEAYSPLARSEILSCELLKSLSEQTGKTPAQIVLRWHLQQGRVVIPKSAHPERIRQNCDLYDFHLDAGQMAKVDTLNQEKSVIRWRPNDGLGWY